MLNIEEVRHIALLARIGLKENEQEQYQKDLSIVLDFFRQLEQVSTDEIILSDEVVGFRDVARHDDVVDCGPEQRRMLLANVPETKNGFVKVKSVF
ncbi:MAG: Asp-tRNA(Asn)/Glu-tRNA(Gln) amidotransferase subunit GatC [Minisyncoccota bacterium]